MLFYADLVNAPGAGGEQYHRYGRSGLQPASWRGSYNPLQCLWQFLHGASNGMDLAKRDRPVVPQAHTSSGNTRSFYPLSMNRKNACQDRLGKHWGNSTKIVFSQSCADPNHPCLFNLKDDPLEENNLFGDTSPAVVEALRKTRELLEGFNRSLIPDQVQPCDMKSCPTHFEPQGCKYCILVAIP